MFDQAMVRFALSGTLILCYGIADHLARRRSPVRPVPSPRWVRPLIVVSITAYYLLIGPTGGPLLGGFGNALGILLVGVAAAWRRFAPVRYPEIGGRSLFYLALPISVGVPWGLLALSLPACAASLYCCLRAERLGLLPAARVETAGPLPRFRLVPGLW